MILWHIVYCRLIRASSHKLIEIRLMWWDDSTHVIPGHNSSNSSLISSSIGEDDTPRSSTSNELQSVRVAVSSNPLSFSMNMSSIMNTLQSLEQSCQVSLVSTQHENGPIPVVTYQVLGLMLGYVVIFHRDIMSHIF